MSNLVPAIARHRCENKRSLRARVSGFGQSHPPRTILGSVVFVVCSSLLTGCAALQPCHHCTTVPVREYSAAQYPDDPSPKSEHFGKYQGRHLILKTASDDRHFDFVFEPEDPRIARIVFRNVDVSLMTPALPQHVKGHTGLQRIALVDRLENRIVTEIHTIMAQPDKPTQQVTSELVEFSGTLGSAPNAGFLMCQRCGAKNFFKGSAVVWCMVCHSELGRVEINEPLGPP